MIKRFCILFTAILTGLVFFSVGTLIAAEKQVVPDTVTIANEGYKKDKKPPVPLSHKAHSTDKKYGPVQCADCHHVYKDGKNVWKEGDHVDKCSKCHNAIKKGKGDYYLKKAFHNNCQKCHKKLAKEAKKEGKTSNAPFKKCKGCHVKK